MTVHSRINRGMAVAAWGLLLVLGTLIALGSTLQGVVAITIGVAWLAYATYAVMWAPALVVDQHGSEIRNPIRTIRIDWDALIHVDTKYALTLHTPGRSWSVWCAPQASALVARRKARRARDERDPRDPRSPLDEGVRLGDIPGTESGDAAALVRARWAALADGRADAEAIAIPVTVHGGRIAALVAGPLLVATVPLLL